jgi:hypothetical protein
MATFDAAVAHLRLIPRTTISRKNRVQRVRMAPKRAKILAVCKKEKRGRYGEGSLWLRGRIWWVI